MKSDSNAILLEKRYVTLVIHKHYVVVTAVNRDRDCLIKLHKVGNECLPEWAEKHLHKK